MSATAYDTLPPGHFDSTAHSNAAPREDVAPLTSTAGVESRVFRGRSIEELIPKIQVELGPDAIIMRRRSGLSGGFAGFFQRRFVEIEARAGTARVDMLDEQVAAAPATTAPAQPPQSQQPPLARQAPATGTVPVPPPAVPVAQTPVAPPLPPAVPSWETSRANSAYGANRGLALPDAPPALTHYEHVRMQAAQAASANDAAPPQASQPPAPPRRPEPTPPEATQPEPAQPQFTTGPQAQARPSQAGPAHAPQPEPLAVTPGESRLMDGDAPAPSPSSQNGNAPASSAATPVSPRDADLDGFRELTPESLLRQPRAIDDTAPVSLHDSDSFAAALADAETAMPRASVESRLLGLGVGPELVGELLTTAARDVLPLLAGGANIADAVRLLLRVRIPAASALPGAGGAIAFVGPGGSGKTACATALAQHLRERDPRPTACATILTQDNEHAMVLEPQLSEPVPIADARVADALRRTREEGALLLFDMPPVSPGDRGSIYTLAALLDVLEADRVILTLPATLGATPAAQLLQGLRPLGASALAITHADETDQLGVAVQAACAFGLAPEYLLDYRRGAAGLLQIGPSYLAERLLPATEPIDALDADEILI